jgi:hypothetical protein
MLQSCLLPSIVINDEDKAMTERRDPLYSKFILRSAYHPSTSSPIPPPPLESVVTRSYQSECCCPKAVLSAVIPNDGAPLAECFQFMCFIAGR